MRACFFLFDFKNVLPSKDKQIVNPKTMTVEEVAATGVLSEYAPRLLIKEGCLPVLRIGNRALINYERLDEDLNVVRIV